MSETQKIVQPAKEEAPVNSEPAPVSVEQREAGDREGGEAQESVEPQKKMSVREEIEALKQTVMEIQKVSTDNFKVIGEFFENLKKQQTTTLPTAAAHQTGDVPDWVKQFAGGIDKVLSSGGGGGDNELLLLQKDSLRQDIELGRSIKNAVIARVTGKAVGEVVDKIVPSS